MERVTPRAHAALRVRIGFARAAIAFVLAGCSSVLGLDPPKRAPDSDPFDTQTTSPSDGGSSPSSDGALAPPPQAPPPVSSPDASSDVGASDHASPTAQSSVRCGGGGFALSFCSASTPVCCWTPDVDGATESYTCVASGGCNSFSILCADSSDCGGDLVCCYGSGIAACTTPDQCPVTHLMCNPNTAGSACPAGLTCTQLTASPNSTLVPYYSCQ